MTSFLLVRDNDEDELEDEKKNARGWRARQSGIGGQRRRVVVVEWALGQHIISQHVIVFCYEKRARGAGFDSGRKKKKNF